MPSGVILGVDELIGFDWWRVPEWVSNLNFFAWWIDQLRHSEW
jgi:hypothetical protein